MALQEIKPCALFSRLLLQSGQTGPRFRKRPACATQKKLVSGKRKRKNRIERAGHTSRNLSGFFLLHLSFHFLCYAHWLTCVFPNLPPRSTLARWQASLVFHPSSPEQVAKALQIIECYDQKFAMRGGGHSPNPGWASIEGGVLISTDRLDTRTTFCVRNSQYRGWSAVDASLPVP